MLRESAPVEEPSGRRRAGREVAFAWLRPLSLVPVIGVAGIAFASWPVLPVAAVTAVSAGIAVLVVTGTRDRPNCG